MDALAARMDGDLNGRPIRAAALPWANRGWRVGRGMCLAALLLSGWARGAATTPDLQTFLMQHHYVGVITNTDIGKNRQRLTTLINGKRVILVVDTGAGRTVIDGECARRLGLMVKDTGHRSLGVGGATEGDDGFALISSFEVNDHEINHLSTIHVLIGENEASNWSGLFGLDSLYLNGAIIPVGGRGFLIKPGATPRASIDSYMVQLGFTGIPLELKGSLLWVDGELNGHPLHGIIDTGAAFSTFSLDYLNRIARVNYAETGMVLEGIDGARKIASKFTPRKLKLGSFTVPPIAFVGFDSPALTRMKADAFIGYDLMASHSGIIDVAGGKLWLR